MVKDFKNPEGMIARWLSVLSTYNFSIEFRRGSLHTNAAAMYRKTHRICKNPSCSDCVNLVKTCERVLKIVPLQTNTLIFTMPIVNQVVLTADHITSDIQDPQNDHSFDSTQFSLI